MQSPDGWDGCLQIGDGGNETTSSATKSKGMFKHGEVSKEAGVNDGNDANKEVTGGSDGCNVGVLKTPRVDGLALASQRLEP